jgi:hypothetical protein
MPADPYYRDDLARIHHLGWAEDGRNDPPKGWVDDTWAIVTETSAPGPIASSAGWRS